MRSNGGALSSASRTAALDGVEALVERGFDLLSERVRLLSEGLAVGRRHRGHLLQDRGELALLAEDLGVLVAERLLGRCRFEATAERRTQGLERPSHEGIR